MHKISSFTVNHLTLLPGLYVSRKDRLKDVTLTTFDLRFTRPNVEPVMDTAGVHAIEHLGATYLRNNPDWKDKVIYFGPMGCRTGFYLILADDLEPLQAMGLVKNLLQFIIRYEGEIPGCSAKECGNYHDMNLAMAQFYAKKYLEEAILSPTEERMNYQ
jgi:S-ribosylhomocysteine lyase